MYQDEGGDRSGWCMMVGSDDGGGETVTSAPTPSGADDECNCEGNCNRSVAKYFLWCKVNGGCSYEGAYDTSKNMGEWCLFEGDAPTSAPTPKPPVPASYDCKSTCNGAIDKLFLWCSSWGGCSYEDVWQEKDDAWCLLGGDGVAPTPSSSPAPTTLPPPVPTQSPTAALPPTKTPTTSPTSPPTTSQSTTSPPSSTSLPSSPPTTSGPTMKPTTASPTIAKEGIEK